MSALRLQTTLGEIEQAMSKIAPHRPFALFERFLIHGYSAVSLNTVPESKFSDLLHAKLCFGTLITLYDDFADRPAQSDPQLLESLYRLRFGIRAPLMSTVSSRQDVIDFARSLFSHIEEVLKPLPNYDQLIDVLNFDLSQFYSANQYSSLVTAHPYLNSRIENRLYAHHNMGMIAVATMDLMAVEHIDFSEFGAIREAVLIGQRMGRIFNVLATRHRETSDGDITGELSTFQTERGMFKAEQELRNEVVSLCHQLAGYNERIKTFSVPSYLQGLMKVQALHEQMNGII